jgi:DNA-directed RNA polymerase subunit RPC12/RpoP
MLKVKAFIAKGRNTSFLCKNCGVKNEALKGGLRNHCKKCLCSLHVDLSSPGDRLSDCKGIMLPIVLDYSGKKGYIIIQKCKKCGKEMKNKKAEDDEFDEILKLTNLGAITK